MTAARSDTAFKNATQSLRAWAAEAEAAAGIAKALAPTAFIPDNLRRWVDPDAEPADRILDYDGTVATVTAVLLAGQELGFGPMASLRAFTIIRGQVAMMALAARALLLQAGHEVIVVESTSQRAVVRARRAPDGEWQESIWDVPRARDAKLYPGHPMGNWARQTKAMLVARATAEASRWVAADAMLGLPAMAEELEDAALDGTVAAAAIESASTSPVPDEGKRQVKHRTTVPRATLPVAAPPRPPEPKPKPEPEPPPERPRAHLTRPQRDRIHKGLHAIGITGRDEEARKAALGLVTAWIGRAVQTTSDLTPEEAVTVIERLEVMLSVRQQDAQGEPEAPPADEERQAPEPDDPPPDDPPPDDPPPDVHDQPGRTGDDA